MEEQEFHEHEINSSEVDVGCSVVVYVSAMISLGIPFLKNIDEMPTAKMFESFLEIDG